MQAMFASGHAHMPVPDRSGAVMQEHQADQSSHTHEHSSVESESPPVPASVFDGAGWLQPPSPDTPHLAPLLAHSSLGHPSTRRSPAGSSGPLDPLHAISPTDRPLPWPRAGPVLATGTDRSSLSGSTDPLTTSLDRATHAAAVATGAQPWTPQALRRRTTVVSGSHAGVPGSGPSVGAAAGTSVGDVMSLGMMPGLGALRDPPMSGLGRDRDRDRDQMSDEEMRRKGLAAHARLWDFLRGKERDLRKCTGFLPRKKTDESTGSFSVLSRKTTWPQRQAFSSDDADEEAGMGAARSTPSHKPTAAGGAAVSRYLQAAAWVAAAVVAALVFGFASYKVAAWAVGRQSSPVVAPGDASMERGWRSSMTAMWRSVRDMRDVAMRGGTGGIGDGSQAAVPSRPKSLAGAVDGIPSMPWIGIPSADAGKDTTESVPETMGGDGGNGAGVQGAVSLRGLGRITGLTDGAGPQGSAPQGSSDQPLPSVGSIARRHASAGARNAALGDAASTPAYQSAFGADEGSGLGSAGAEAAPPVSGDTSGGGPGATSAAGAGMATPASTCEGDSCESIVYNMPHNALELHLYHRGPASAGDLVWMAQHATHVRAAEPDTAQARRLGEEGGGQGLSGTVAECGGGGACSNGEGGGVDSLAGRLRDRREALERAQG